VVASQYTTGFIGRQIEGILSGVQKKYYG
jgi:hypothetical protein